jgi:hypothetical protein
MNCKKFWNSEFLDATMTKSWRNGDYRKHRAAILLDREKSLLPATQPAVEVELGKRAAKIEHDALQAEYQALKLKLDHLHTNIMDKIRILNAGPWGDNDEKKEKRQFVAACPKESCRGFLSSAYKCGTCQDHVCSDCREILGPVRDIPHTCDPALVETIKAIQKDSRPCPKCGVSISRVEGCDQMFCTQCDTAFSYAKGTIIQGAIHNPHYFARLQQLGQTALDQAGAGGGGGCRWPDYGRAVLAYQSKVPKRDFQFLTAMYRAAIHVQHVELGDRQNQENVDIRVKYLLKDIDEAAFGRILHTRERRNERRADIRGPLELFVITMLEFYIGIATRGGVSGVPERINTCRETIRTINEALQIIGTRYGCIVPQIVETESGNAFVPRGSRKVHISVEGPH